jgi:hypothetical protein
MVLRAAQAFSSFASPNELFHSSKGSTDDVIDVEVEPAPDAIFKSHFLWFP